MSTNRRLVNFDQKTRRLNAPMIIAVVMVCLMGAMVLHGWSQTNSFVPAIQVLLGTAPGDAAGQVISQGDITLYIPPNATDKQGSFSIAEANPDVTLISNDTEWIRPKVVNVEFWQPNGVPLSNISFSEPVEICFGMNNEQWQAFVAQPEAFEVHHYVHNGDQPYWEVLPQISYAERQQLCGQTLELSAFALAIRVEAQVPVTGPTATGIFSTLVPTRTRVGVGPTQTRNPERGGASSGSTLGDGPGAPTATPRPINTLRPADTATLQPTNTLRPPNTPTLGPTSTKTPRPPTRTPRPPTSTPSPTNEPTDVPNTPTRRPSSTPTNEPPPTATPRPPTATDEPATNTPRPPTATDPPPTATDIPPTDPPPTDPPPTDPPPTDPPPTDPPTEEPTPESGGGF